MTGSCGKRVMLVLGMHRSGTSALARALSPLGVELGDRLPPAGPDNEMGYWEDLDFQALNIELLRALGRDWDTLALLPPATLADSRLDQLRVRALQLTRDKLETCDVFGIKDPRMPLLLPFWQDVFNRLGVDAGFVLSLRNPLSVAHSLHSRNGFASEKSYYLWLQHTVAAVLGTAHHRRVVVSYDRLLGEPGNELRRIGAALDLPVDRRLAEGFEREFLRADLRHSRFGPEELDLDAAVPRDAVRAFSVLTRCAVDEMLLSDPEVEETFFRIEENLRALAPALIYMSHCDEALSRVRRDGEERAAELHAELREAREQLTVLELRLQASLAETEAAEAELSRIRKREAQLELALHSLGKSFTTSIAELRVQVRSLRIEMLEARSAYEMLWARFADLLTTTRNAETLEVEAKTLRIELDEARRNQELLAARLSESRQLLDDRDRVRRSLRRLLRGAHGR